jgi:hypothetical protein
MMVGTQMFIMYGQTGASTLDNGVYVLDTVTWTWQTTYTPSNLNYTNTGLLPAPVPGSGQPSTQNSGSGIDNGSGSTSGSGGGSNTKGGGGNGSGGGDNSSSNKGAIIGGSIGGVALVLVLAALAAIAWKRNRKRKGELQKATVYPLTGTDSHRTYFPNHTHDNAPPCYQQYQHGTNGEKISHSLHSNSFREFTTYPSSFQQDFIIQKPNTPVEYQKPNVGE